VINATFYEKLNFIRDIALVGKGDQCGPLSAALSSSRSAKLNGSPRFEAAT
jgi:hypothetical protein